MSNTLKLKWRVDPPPVGRYRSFSQRGWPSAYFENGDPAVMLTCATEYVPSQVKTSDHEMLNVFVSDWRPESNPKGGAFTWRRLTTRYATLDQAKKSAEHFLEQHPDLYRSRRTK